MAKTLNNIGKRNLDIKSANAPKQKLNVNTFDQSRMLTLSELELLKQDMLEASNWMAEQPLPKNKKLYNLPS